MDSKNGDLETGGFKMKVCSTASTSVSVRGPKKPGTFDPENPEDEDQFCYVVPQMYLTKCDENDKFTTIEEE